MLREISDEEELESFRKLKPGSLFDLGTKRFFIVVEKLSDKELKVIELTEVNKRKIISGQPCEQTSLSFDDMRNLNLRP